MNKHETIINEDLEHHRAARWRRRILLMKTSELAEAIGWSARQIYQMETGFSHAYTTIKPDVWRRYKQACAGIHAQKYGWTAGRTFEWRA